MAVFAAMTVQCTAFAPGLSRVPLKARAAALSGAVRAPAPLLGLRADAGGAEKPKTMERPLGDNIVTKAIYAIEMARVKAMSVRPDFLPAGAYRRAGQPSTVRKKVPRVAP
jgi:hypothetical protein